MKTILRNSENFLLLIILAIIILAAGFKFFTKDSFSGDDGFYILLAKNINYSNEYFFKPSSIPQGQFEPHAIAHPPVNSLFRACFLKLSGGGLWGARLSAWLLFTLFLVGIFYLVKGYRKESTLQVILITVSSYALMDYFNSYEPEPLLLTSGIFSCLFLINGLKSQKWFMCCLAGFFLGLCYSVKTYLSFPFFAFSGIFLFFAFRAHKDITKFFIFFILCIPIIPVLHLLSVYAYSPDEFNFWMRKIYFPFLSSSEIISLQHNTTNSSRVHPLWYYAAIIYRDFFIIIPLLIFQLKIIFEKIKSKNEFLITLSVTFITWFLISSAVSTKEPYYILAIIPMIYIIAGFGLDELKLNRKSKNFYSLVCTFFLLLIPIAYVMKIKRDDINTEYVIIHSAFYCLLLIAINLKYNFRNSLFVVLGITFFCSFFIHHNNKISDIQLAEHIKPILKNSPPDKVSYIHKNHKALGMKLFKRGAYRNYFSVVNGELEHTVPEEDSSYIKVIIGSDDELSQDKEFYKWLSENFDKTDFRGETIYIKKNTSANP